MVLGRRTLASIVALAIVVAAALLVRHEREQRPPALTFAGTQVCASCHRQAYENWLQSDHWHAMETASPQSVLGDFKDARFDYFGTTSRFFAREGKYYVETDNAQGELQTFPIAYTFGHYPLQQYLIQFPDGRLQALSISWDSRPAAQGGQRWYHLYPNEKITHDDPLHWTGAFQNWNSRCASCHSTNLVKNYSGETDRYDTRWSEINVGCEACHGPGSRHVAWANGNHSLENKGLSTHLARVWEPAGGKLPIPQHADALSGQIQVCAGCHSRRSELQQPDVAASYFDNYSLSPLLDGRYFADGQAREEVYVTGSFLQSRMHANHVSCTNCHDPHTGHLRVKGNGLCLQCHDAQKFQTPAHFFHQPDSPGAQCVSCHMPQQTYMGVDARRDHSFRIPDPIASVQLGVPNACTQCHRDRDDAWAADFISRRTGRTQPWYRHATLLSAARKNVASIAPDLLAYARDSGNPPILRSIMLIESARFPSGEQLDAVSASLTSADPLVRMGGVSALADLDVNERARRLQPLLADPAKSVRMMVARELIDVPLSQAPAEMRSALEKLFDEYEQSLQHNADMPEAMNDLGLFHAAQGDLDAAEKAILHARKLSPGYLPAMLNLADIYRARNRDDLGEPVLREALTRYPKSGEVQHALGLLYVRTGRTAESVALFRSASALEPDNAQFALVYAMALMETGSTSKGIAALEAAAKRFPSNEVITKTLSEYRGYRD